MSEVTDEQMIMFYTRYLNEYDIADDISYKSRRNYTLNHLIERIKVYNEENFNYDIVKIPLKN